MNKLIEPSRLIASEEALHYVKHALSDNSRKAYKQDMAHFRSMGGVIPCAPEDVANYISGMAGKFAISTIKRRLVSVSKAHSLLGYESPVKSEIVRLAMQGISRLHGEAQKQAAPLLKEDLLLISSQIPDSLKSLRDKALLLIGFCAALRRSELVALNWEDIAFTSQGLVISIRKSKTDQGAEGRKVGIPYGRGRVCPVLTLINFQVRLSTQKGISMSALEGAVFPALKKGEKIAGNRLSPHAVSEIIKGYAAAIGLDGQLYSGHSLRAGLATSAAQHGVSSWKIRAQTGHKSDGMLARYIREGDLFNNNAAALF